MKFQRGFTIIELIHLFIVALVIAGIPGWIWNIVKLASMSFDPITGMLVLRIVGIFVAPLGAIVGYF